MLTKEIEAKAEMLEEGSIQYKDKEYAPLDKKENDTS